MITKVWIKNYGPYVEETLFDFTINNNSNTEEFPFYEGQNTKVLNIAGIFGRNSSGKSILIDAIQDVRYIIQERVLKLENKLTDTTQKVAICNKNIFYGQEKPTTMKVELLIQENVYFYSYTYNEEGFISEEFKINNRNVFIRENKKINIAYKQKKYAITNWYSGFSIVEEMDGTDELVELTKIFIEKISRIQILSIKNIQKMKLQYFTDITCKYLETLSGGFEGLKKVIHEEFNVMFKAADLSVDSLMPIKEKVQKENGEITDKYYLRPSNIPNGKSITLSTGTVEFIKTLLVVMIAKKTNGIILWDEFGSLLHPKLSSLLLTYLSKTKTNKQTQIIFNSNHASLIETLHRKQLFFLNRFENEGTEIWKPKYKDSHNKSLYKGFLRGSIPGGPDVDFDDIPWE